MFNIEYEYFKSVAKIASEALNTMSIIWEQMQFNGTEPKGLEFNNKNYPFNDSFDDVASRFTYWLETLEEEPTEEAEEKLPYYEEPKTECFYTGGGIWCTIYQLSGELSDYYYGIGSEEENGGMYLFSHKEDKGYNDDEYAFGGVVRYIDISEATEAEKQIYYIMAKEEEKTLKENGCFSEEYKRL